MSGDMFDHVCFLSEGSVTYIASEGLLSRVDFQVLLKIEAFWVDQETTDRTTLVIRPMVIHVKVEVVQIAQETVAFNAIYRPDFVLDLILIIGHRRLIEIARAQEFLFFRSIIVGWCHIILRFSFAFLRRGIKMAIAIDQRR